MRGGLIIAIAALAPVLALAQPDQDNAVDERIRSSAAAAEALQGPLDGPWTLVSTARDRRSMPSSWSTVRAARASSRGSGATCAARRCPATSA